MENYTPPKMEFVELKLTDVITTSPGTEITPKDETDGIWDFDIG